MARPETIKTDLARRLRAVREELGDPTREAFAGFLGVSTKTLGNYERGDNVPDAEALKAYKVVYGVNVNWLLTGDGEMFDLPPKPQAPIRLAASAAPDSARPARFVRFDQADILRLERAVTIVEEGLEAAGRVARPEVKAGMISAAFEMLEEPSETTVGRILRLVKG